MKIGIVGAGFIGRAVARLASRHGHEVMISNSRGPQSLTSTAIALRCKTGTVAEAAAFGDVVVLAVPMPAGLQLDPWPFAGKVVLDANNHYPQRDGPLPELLEHRATTSGLLQRHLHGARVVKAFNAILQEDLEKDARPAGSPDRRALPIAGDDAQARALAAELIDQFGFDVVDAGPLEDSWRFERAMPAYCVPLNAAQLREALTSARRGVEVPHGSWRPGPVQPAKAGAAHPVGFAGRGSLDIVDGQVHLMPQQDAAAMLAAMDALGIRAAILSEYWGRDAQGVSLPHARLADGTCRPLGPGAMAASLRHPQRFGFLQRVVRQDAQLASWIALLAQTPGCRSLRITLLDDDERARFAAGEFDELLGQAQRHELPVSVLAQDSGRLLARAAERFGGVRFVVDHCGWGRTPEHWEDVLKLARLPNTVLKWSHARKAFRRFNEPEAALRHEFLRAVETFGAERVLWAGDVSHEESNASWSELLSFVRDQAGLSEGDRAWVLGRTARRVYRWDA